MDQLIEFIGNHWLLVASWLLVIGLLVYVSLTGSKLNVSPLNATEMINHRDAVVLDVRPMADFSQGHILGAVNVPLNGLKKSLGTLDKYKGRPIIVACRSGNQSQLAARQLRAAGFDEVYNLAGGMIGWQSANLPTTRK